MVAGPSLLIIALVLTFALRGAVSPQTIRVVNAEVGSKPYGESDSAFVVGYTDNFAGWYIGYEDQNVAAQVINESGSLIISGQFQPVGKYTSIAVFKQVSIGLSSFPILEASLNASSGIGYGLRFYSKFQNGTTVNIWWEDSALDHRPGVGPESIRANIEYQALLATGNFVGSLDSLEIYIEAGPNTARNFSLSITQYQFGSDSLSPLSSQSDLRAVYVDMAALSPSEGSWSLEKVHFGVTVTATVGTVLEMFLVRGSRVYSSLSPSNYVYSALNRYNEFTFYPSDPLKIFPDVMPPSNDSVILLAKTGTIQSLAIDSLDFIFMPANGSSSTISPDTFSTYYATMIIFLFLIPVTLALLIFWRFFQRLSIGRIPPIAVAVVGFLCRFAIAPIAVHRFDMSVFLASARGWYQYGTPSGSIGPTLPLTFLFYWMPYSFYALFQLVGFHDIFLPTHQEGIVEGIFIRMFPFAMDALVFFVLLQFRKGGKSLVWATFYLLNPLVIYVSAVWGQYDGASVALISLGTFWLARGKTGRAGLTFVLSGMVQLLGFISYALTVTRIAVQRKYSSLIVLLCAFVLTAIYWPETLLLYLLVLAASGLTKSLALSGPGQYTILGNIPSLSFLSASHPLLLSLVALGIVALFFTVKGRMTPASIVLFTGLVSISLLLFSSILAGWVWVIPIMLLYATLKEKEGLGVFSIVFGTSTAFSMMSYTIGSRYVLTGNPGYPVVPALESVANGVQVFAVSVTLLTMILLLLMWRGNYRANRTLVITSGFVFALNLVLIVFGGIEF